MQGSTKRKVLTRNAAMPCSSKAGSKVLNGKESHRNQRNAGEEGTRGQQRLRRNQSDSAASERARKSNYAAASDKEENSTTVGIPALLTKSHSDLSISPKTLCENSVVGGDEVNVEEEEEEIEMKMENGVKSFVDKEMDQPEEKPKSMEVEEEEIPLSVEEEEKNQNLESMLSMDVVEKKQILKLGHRLINPDPAVQPHFETEEDEEEFCASNSTKDIRMQSIENLVMWRDVSRSAFVFGFGSFLLFSFSYAKDVNFSIISASSYIGLVYLAFVFLSRSIINSGEKMECDEKHIVEEEDAIWVLKMLLPYVNELLVKLRRLFSGDPATTLKLAGLLFVMARCGSAITIWSLVKLMFFGVFTIPKFCSSYSPQLEKLGKFWFDRVRDGWESCTHKKAAGTAIFALIWNVSSTAARIWAFFMLAVAVKLYQQFAEECSGWSGQEEEGQEDSMAGQGGEGLECIDREVDQLELRERKGGDLGGRYQSDGGPPDTKEDSMHRIQE